MNREITEAAIQLKDEAINGKLKVIGSVWRFETEHPVFKALFPTGSVCSFSSEKELKDPKRIEVFQAVQQRVAAMYLS
jgi:hypothetical protein